MFGCNKEPAVSSLLLPVSELLHISLFNSVDSAVCIGKQLQSTVYSDILNTHKLQYHCTVKARKEQV